VQPAAALSAAPPVPLVGRQHGAAQHLRHALHAGGHRRLGLVPLGLRRSRLGPCTHGCQPLRHRRASQLNHALRQRGLLCLLLRLAVRLLSSLSHVGRWGAGCRSGEAPLR
jgi:hypothetical protein